MSETDLPSVTAMLTPDNWQEEINRMACQSAHDSLRQLGAAASLELAFALLQAYFTLTYSASLPFVEHDGTLPARIDTLRKIIESCGLEIETNITTARHV
ncbi:MAG: hypothetical protein IKZ07_03860 [Akkermansia sp.]|nr:hypothetical protein [Akkermansia sp.]